MHASRGKAHLFFPFMLMGISPPALAAHARCLCRNDRRHYVPRRLPPRHTASAVPVNVCRLMLLLLPGHCGLKVPEKHALLLFLEVIVMIFGKVGYCITE